LGGESYGHVRPFNLCNGTFDDNVIDLPVIITTLSLSVEIGIATSDNCDDCAMCGEIVGLLRRFLDLRWGWIGLSFDLRVGVVWHGVCNGGYVICGAGEG
jgi:hypothetical protein